MIISIYLISTAFLSLGAYYTIKTGWSSPEVTNDYHNEIRSFIQELKEERQSENLTKN